LKPQVWAVGIVVGIVVGIAIEVVKAAYHHTLLQWGAFFSLHSILFVLTFSVAVVLATVGIRRFRALTDLSIGYSYSFIPRNGWMPDMRVQSSPSAPRHVLGNIKVTKKVKLFGYEGETLGGFDNSPMGKIIEPGTITYFRAGICSIADGQPGHPPTLLELQAGKVNAWEAWNYHVASQKLLVRTEGGLEFKASGPGDLLPAWKVRLYQVRKWLDKYLFKPTK
jgi:hypothetical protein